MLGYLQYTSASDHREQTTTQKHFGHRLIPTIMETMLCEEATRKRYRFRTGTLVQNADENISNDLIQQQIYSVKEANRKC